MIHPTAIISSDAQIGADVEICPYAVIDGPVILGDRVRIGPHAHICGHTTIGADTTVHLGANVGDTPQDHSYAGATSYVDIGEHCTIREYVTIHRGAEEGGRTVIGNHVLLMAFVHVAHNCIIGDHVNVANNSIIAGHIEIGECAFVSGAVAMHQFIHIGAYSMVSAQARLPKDVPPYCILGDGNRIYPQPNVIGLRRAGFKRDQRNAIKDTIKIFFFSDLNRDDALAAIEEKYADFASTAVFCNFIRASKRGSMSGRARQDS
jgi:UDP-N-acetylglucosamine acyltransferase